jgi:hypothetical protein
MHIANVRWSDGRSELVMLARAGAADDIEMKALIMYRVVPILFIQIKTNREVL